MPSLSHPSIIESFTFLDPLTSANQINSQKKNDKSTSSRQTSRQAKAYLDQLTWLNPDPPPPLLIFRTKTANVPLHFALLLFPSFQALDVFGPFDALNTIKRRYPSLPLRLSILHTTLAPVSTFPTLHHDSNDNDPTFAPFEQKICPTHTYTSPPSHPIDILFIPGGIGTRSNVGNDNSIDESGWKPVVSYLNHFFSSPASVKNLKGIFTVCTGSVLLGRSKLSSGKKGTLDGVHATTNKNSFRRTKEELKHVIWEPKARWVRTDLSLPLSTESNVGSGSEHMHIVKLWTTSGVSAGTDGIFALIEEEYGADVAELTAQILEYKRKTDPNDDPFAVQLE